MLTTELKKNDNRYMYSILSVIPALYAISIGIALINIQVAIIFPVIMVPTMTLLGQAFIIRKMVNLELLRMGIFYQLKYGFPSEVLT